MNEKNDDSKCPCCGLEFKSAISMKNHIVKINDCKHKLLAFIYNELKTPTEIQDEWNHQLLVLTKQPKIQNIESRLIDLINE